MILADRGTVLMEHRPGRVGQARAPQMLGASAPATAPPLATAVPGDHHATLGGDQGEDPAAFVAGCRDLAITPPVAQNSTDYHGSAIDGRTRGALYAVGPQARERLKARFRGKADRAPAAPLRSGHNAAGHLGLPPPAAG